MYCIAIDDNGYYKIGDGNLVEVNDIPNVYPLERLMAYKYNENTKMLILDEEKQKEIDKEIGYTSPVLDDKETATSATAFTSSMSVVMESSADTSSHITMPVSTFLNQAAKNNSLVDNFTITEANGYSFDTSSYDTIGLRMGKLCFISFALNTAIKGGAFYTVGTIPTGYRPSKSTKLIKQYDAANDVSLIIDTNGNIKLYYHASTSSSVSGIHATATYSL